jgi:hypothetical protein
MALLSCPFILSLDFNSVPITFRVTILLVEMFVLFCPNVLTQFYNNSTYNENMSTESDSSTWLFLIIAAAVLFFTNPSLEKHKDKAANEAMAVFKESKVYGMLNSFSFGKGDELILNSIKGGTHRNNYFLFSLTTMQLSKENETTTIGIGILGVVYIFDDAKQELKSQIDSYDSAAGLFLGS